MDAQLAFTLNGQRTSVAVDPTRSLLEVLREDLGLTGAKYGCGEAQCGACSVLLDGKRVFACRTAASKVAGAEVTTIEGLTTRDKGNAGKSGDSGVASLHPVQEAFIAEGAYQCGYCVPGMVIAAVALLKENPKPTDEQIVEGMNRNLCRCCNYGNLIAAVRRASVRGGGRRSIMSIDTSKAQEADDFALQLAREDPRAYDEPVDRVTFNFAPTRRDVLATLGAGILLVIAAPLPLDAQAAPGGAPGGAPRPGGGRPGGGRRGGFGGGGANRPVAARLHIGKDGVVTVMTGKVECGQGSRAEITQAAAEELRVPPASIRLIMADTQLCPDDGTTAGSRTTPSTIPAIRQGCAAARELLLRIAAKKWNLDAAKVRAAGGKITADGGHEISYAEVAADEESVKAFAGTAPADVAVTPIADWKVLGVPLGRPNASDIVTGNHRYPSDITRPGMLYGKILRAPSYGAKLTSVDLAPAKAIAGVVAVQDGTFVGVAAPKSAVARQALELLEKSAKWETSPQVSSKELYDHLRKKIRGGLPKNPFTDDVAKADKSLKQPYHVAYVQHAPMETRTAVAEWENGKLTVWTATQNPFAVRGELALAFRLTDDKVRVIVPDFGGGFGGKHSGECAVECARLAQSAGKPVSLQWTREEEFTWAYFRPAALIETEASLDDQGNITSWYFVNVNSGGSAVETPYRIAKNRCLSVSSEPPLRHGSYRALASTANIFARESLMDELARLAGKDPLAFRLAHLDNPRLRAVLEEAGKQFDWSKRFRTPREPGYGLGLSCGTEKGSFVAACVEVIVDKETIHVRRVCQAYECGKVLNPSGLRSQIEGAIVMGIGPALREAMQFENGQMQTTAFSDYKVPRFADVPAIDVRVLDRPDLPSIGAGETPIVAVAPAIANAVFDAVGKRVREMPIQLSKADAPKGENGKAGAKT